MPLKKLCKCGKPIRAKGMCNNCYNKDWNKRNPEKFKATNRKNHRNHPRTKEQNREQRRRYLDRHPEIRQKYYAYIAENREELQKRQICKILKKHAEELKDDPERLSTKFLQNLIGIKCKKDV